MNDGCCCMSENTISLRDHIESRFREIDGRCDTKNKILEIALIAVKEALVSKDRADRDISELTRSTQDYKNEKTNQLLEQLSRERGDYATKKELDTLGNKVEALQKFLWMGLGALLAIQLFIGIVFTFLKKGSP